MLTLNTRSLLATLNPPTRQIHVRFHKERNREYELSG